MSKLNLVLFQSEIIWENPESNRLRIEQGLLQIKAGTADLILFPEMFSTGFSMSPDGLAEPMDGPTVQWMKAQAAKLQAVLAGSLIITEADKFYNRFLFAYPNGSIQYYDKRHLFTLAGEDDPYQAGQKRVLLEINGWKIMPQICYDLRFPTWSRNNLNYDLLVYVANWPKPRHQAWRNLLVARAIENQAYVVGVNRTGQDDNGLEYLGGSAVIDYQGERLLDLEQTAFQRVTIEKEPMQAFRKKLNFLADQDAVEISL